MRRPRKEYDVGFVNIYSDTDPEGIRIIYKKHVDGHSTLLDQTSRLDRAEFASKELGLHDNGEFDVLNDANDSENVWKMLDEEEYEAKRDRSIVFEFKATDFEEVEVEEEPTFYIVENVEAELFPLVEDQDEFTEALANFIADTVCHGDAISADQIEGMLLYSEENTQPLLFFLNKPESEGEILDQDNFVGMAMLTLEDEITIDGFCSTGYGKRLVNLLYERYPGKIWRLSSLQPSVMFWYNVGFRFIKQTKGETAFIDMLLEKYGSRTLQDWLNGPKSPGEVEKFRKIVNRHQDDSYSFPMILFTNQFSN